MIAPTAPIIRNEEAPHGGDYAQGFPGVEHACLEMGTRRRKHTPPKEQEKPREGSHRGWRNV